MRPGPQAHYPLPRIYDAMLQEIEVCTILALDDIKTSDIGNKRIFILRRRLLSPYFVFILMNHDEK